MNSKSFRRRQTGSQAAEFGVNLNFAVIIILVTAAKRCRVNRKHWKCWVLTVHSGAPRMVLIPKLWKKTWWMASLSSVRLKSVAGFLSQEQHNVLTLQQDIRSHNKYIKFNVSCLEEAGSVFSVWISRQRLKRPKKTRRKWGKEKQTSETKRDWLLLAELRKSWRAAG